MTETKDIDFQNSNNGDITTGYSVPDSLENIDENEFIDTTTEDEKQASSTNESDIKIIPNGRKTKENIKSLPDENNNDLTKIKVSEQKSSNNSQYSNKSEAKESILKKTTLDKYKSTSKKNNNTVIRNYSSKTQHVRHLGVLKERFILTEIIGTGGMGVVYKAKDILKVEAKDSDPYVAIKVLSEEFKQHPEAFIALQRESRKSQRIAHPNIVNVYDFDRDGETFFMTMELMEGKPLDQVLREFKFNGLARNYAWTILKSVCSALIHAHSENIIHSDLKPGNIFITSKKITKVFDFGIARAVATVTHDGDTVEDKTIFDAGNLGALTPAYASLEMLNGESPDIRDDVYALGCVAYQILTGTHPFNRVSADEAHKQGLNPKKITNITKRQWQAIESALAFKREDRINTVRGFLEEIETNKKREFTYPVMLILTIVILGFVFIPFNSEKVISETELRQKIEYEIKLNSKKTLIESLLTTADFSLQWQTKIWDEFVTIDKLLQSIEKHYSKQEFHTIKISFISMRKNIVERYLKKIIDTRESGDFSKTTELLKKSIRYTQTGLILEQAPDLMQALEIEKQHLKAEYINSKTLLNEKIISERKVGSQTTLKKETVEQSTNEPKKHNVNSLQAILSQKKNEFFNKTLIKVNLQLHCKNSLAMNKLNTNIRKLNSFNPEKYLALKPQLIDKLVMCITDIAKTKPKQALNYKYSALKIFTKNKQISAIIINH